MKEKDVLRVVDANLNRLREALRVCEEITRFVIEDKGSTARLKKIRHEVLKATDRSKKLRQPALVLSRDSQRDIGKHSILDELRRRDSSDILSANLQRAKESSRVLEEFSKIIDSNSATEFKKIRFKIYNIEKILIKRLL